VHFPGAAVAASETTTAATVAISAAAAAAVSTPEGVSSVIKTHFRFTSASSGKHSHKNMIGYNLLFKTKVEFLITDYISHHFYLILQSFYYI
jgi:hypothetical protein